MNGLHLRRWGSALGLAALSAALAAPYTSAKYGFTITPPANWTQSNVPGFAADFFLAPAVSGKFRANFNVLEAIPMGNVGHASACQQNAAALPKVLNAAHVTRQRYDKGADVCEITYQANQNGIPISGLMQLRFEGGKYRALTYTSARTDYNKWLAQVRASFQTYKSVR